MIENTFEYLENSDLYYDVIENGLFHAKYEVLISTANLKGMLVQKNKKYVSIAKIFSSLVNSGVRVRLLHAGEPSKAFKKSLRGTTLLQQKNFLMLQCPRVHFKTIIVDNEWMYAGSANMTGAGLGSKSDLNRNFEIGFKITDKRIIKNTIIYFDRIWSGALCSNCGRRDICPKPII